MIYLPEYLHGKLKGRGWDNKVILAFLFWLRKTGHINSFTVSEQEAEALYDEALKV